MQIFGFWGRVNPLSHGLRRASSPEGGSFISADRQIAKSSPFGGAGERSEPERVRSQASVLALSVFASQIHLSQRERPWQRDEVCVDCQGLPLWGNWHRAAMTERASQLKVVPPSCIYHIFIDNKPHFAVNWEHKTGAAPEKGRKANERYSTL